MTIPYNLLRNHYERNRDEIINLSKKNRWCNAYANEIDFVSIMSPIEFSAWQAIRSICKIPLYPQYPVGQYWVDFANPHHKIVLECDGKEFHQDIEKDKDRDYFLNSMGWTVYRATGSECNKIVSLYIEDEDYYDREEIYQDKLVDYYKLTVDGLIKSLAIKYCDVEVDEFELNLSQRCLNDHISISDFYEFQDMMKQVTNKMFMQEKNF